MKQRHYRKGVLVVHAKKKNPLRLDPSRTGTIRRAFVKELAKRFAKLKLALRALVVDEDAFGLKSSPSPVGNAAEYHGTLDWEQRRRLGRGLPLVENQSVTSGCRGMRLIEVPDIRQPNHFYCGASATFAVTSYYGVGTRMQEETAMLLGTNVEQSTHPEAIVAYLRSLGLAVEVRDHMTVADLAEFHARGWPVICPVQDYNDRREPGAKWDYGHYLTVIGVGFGYVFCQDSSIENLKMTPGGDVPLSKEQEADLSAPGRIMVREKHWLANWHDEDIDGNKFVHYGIAVGPGTTPSTRKTGEVPSELDPLGGVVPSSLERAQAVDLVTLPPDMSGTNCGICRFIQSGFCTHPDVRMVVNDRMCCGLWEAKGMLRAWEGTIQNVEKECPLDPDECDEENWIEASSIREASAGVRGHSIILDEKNATNALSRENGLHGMSQGKTLLSSREEMVLSGMRGEVWRRSSSNHCVATDSQVTSNTRWKFTTDADKLKRFAEWLKAEFGKDLTSSDAEALWRKYVEDGFKKGAGRAFDDTRRAERALSAGDQAKMDFYAGSRDEFLRSSFGRPETVEKVQLLAARSFSELDGVTDAMEQRMTRVLADGLVQGKNPSDIARDLDDEVDIGRNRAEAIARTEIIRAHAEGQLDALENLGVEEVGVAVEFTVTDDEALCERCAALEGVVLKIEEAHGLIPVHVNCRCSFIPANVGEDDEGQKDTKREIDVALADADIDGVSISTSRPQSILNQLQKLLANEGGEVPEQEEGAAATKRVIRRRSKKGKTIGVPPPAVDEDVIQTEGQVGPESLDKRVKKQEENEDAPPRNEG